MTDINNHDEIEQIALRAEELEDSLVDTDGSPKSSSSFGGEADLLHPHSYASHCRSATDDPGTSRRSRLFLFDSAQGLLSLRTLLGLAAFSGVGFFLAFLLVVPQLGRNLKDSPQRSQDSPSRSVPDVSTSETGAMSQPMQHSFALKETCGNGSGWRVTGPPQAQLLSTIQEQYCADAFVNSSDRLQVASFREDRKARHFANYLSRQTGRTFTIEATPPVDVAHPMNGSLAEEDATLDSTSAGNQIRDTTGSRRLCILQNSNGRDRQEMRCTVAARTNRNGNSVYDIEWADGDKSVYVFWRNGSVEVIPTDGTPLFYTYTVNAGGVQIDAHGTFSIGIPDLYPDPN